ncbi:MAG: caspase family protein [Smithellaceae bacterium]|nr:caspase family protein [Smithellaceae bacterium]
MLRFKYLWRSLFASLGMIVILSVSLVFAAEKLVPAASQQGPEIFLQLGHSAWVQTLDMSKDGKYLLSGAWGGAVKLWDVQTGREIRTLSGHKSAPSLAFAPDGLHAVSFEEGADGGIIRLWDLPSGHEIYTFTKKGLSLLMPPITFVSRGKYFMIADTLRLKVHLWETSTGREMGGLDLKDVRTEMIASPDGRFVLTQEPGEMRLMGYVSKPTMLWNLLTGRVINEFKKDISKFNSAFTPDGSHVLSYNDNSLELWDVATKRVLWFVKGGHTGSVDFISIADNGAVALTAGNDGTVRVWDIATGRVVKVIASPRGFKPNKLSPDGRKLLFGDGDGGHITLSKTVKLFDTVTGQEIKTLKKDGAIPFKNMSFAPDGQRLLLMRLDGGVTLWDIATDREVQRFEGRGQTITSVNFAPRRNIAAIVGRKDVALWDIATGERVMVLKGHGQDVSSTAFSPTTDTLVTGSLDTTLRFWDLKSGKEKLSVPGHNGGVLSVAYSPDGRYLASAGNDAQVKLRNGSTGALLKTFTGHIQGKGSAIYGAFNGVYDVRFSPDGKTIASAGTDGTARLWDIATGKEIKSLRGHDGNVISVAFSPDGRFLASGGYDGTVRLWDAKSGKELKALNKDNHDGSVTFVGYSPDGKYVFARGKDEIVRLWSAENGQEIKQFAGMRTLTTMVGTMNSASVSPDSRYLLTNDGPGAVSRVWDIAAGREITHLISFTDGEWIAITPEGYFNASRNGAKHLNVRVGNQVYGIDQFYAKFYRPELVALALTGKAMPKGELITDIAAQKPAPKVQILSPVANSSVDQDSVAVTLKITDSGGGIGSVNIYLNGAQVANDTRGVIVLGKAAANEKILSFTIPLIKGQNEIRAVAFNGENSMESNPARISVMSRAVLRKPDLYALVIGINTYKNQSISLTYAVPDAIAFAGTLQKVVTPLFEKADIRTLTTPAATTKEAITKAFEEIRQLVKPNDLFIFYNASHGMVDVVNGEEQYFLLTSNVRLLSSQHIGKDALSHKDLVSLIGSIPAQKKLVILDTCNAGKGGKEIQIALLQQTRGLTDATAVKLLQRAVGSSVFSASSDTQQALEGYKGHGLFTYVLLEGLQGEADFKKDGFITVKGLALHTEERVMTLSEEVFKRQQNPMIETGANDFPIGRVK